MAIQPANTLKLYRVMQDFHLSLYRQDHPNESFVDYKDWNWQQYVLYIEMSTHLDSLMSEDEKAKFRQLPAYNHLPDFIEEWMVQ